MFKAFDNGTLSSHARTCLMLFACLSTYACVATEENEGHPGYYHPSGWLHLEDALNTTDFATYQSTVTKRVQKHRFIINTASAADEVALVSPAEFAPTGSECVMDAPRGIVILVHGLTDTAFAMRDLAAALAVRCYRTRTLLLPGHGTVPGDLLAVDHHDWLDTVRGAIEHAATENENIVVIGFSLGAVIGLSLALEPTHPIDALVTISPAFHLSTWRIARWAPWLQRLRPWIDRELPDDRFRYEAMPTRGVAETVRTIHDMRRHLSANPNGVDIPWMLLQSMDDAVTVPAANLQFFLNNTTDPRSRALLFRSTEDPTVDSNDARVIVVDGADAATRVLGLTHVAVHVSPENTHYGTNGDYRNCGATGGRKAAAVKLCEAAAIGEFDYALWNGPENTTGRPQARSTFNPHFEHTVDAIATFLVDSSGKL